MSESVPTSVSGFRHRHQRADSSASLPSFAYYDEEQDSGADDDVDSALLDDGESEYNGYTVAELADMEAGVSSPSQSQSSHSPSPSRRKSSGSRKVR
jgi:cation-transporting ATPase 13A2